MDRIKTHLVTFYQNYKYLHFYSICFGLGWVTALFSPTRPVGDLRIYGYVFAFFAFLFEIGGFFFETPAHIQTYQGRPYEKADVCWGCLIALLVAVLNKRSDDVFPVCCGCGLLAFSISGVIRKCRSIRRLRAAQRPRW